MDGRDLAVCDFEGTWENTCWIGKCFFVYEFTCFAGNPLGSQRYSPFLPI